MTAVTMAPQVGSDRPRGHTLRRSTRASRRRTLAGLAFIAPGVLLYGVVILWPALQALLISFQAYQVRQGLASPWVGFANYARALEDPVVASSFQNALLYTVITVPTQLLIGLGLALLLDKAMPGRTFFRVLFYLPVVTSWVVVSLLFKWMFGTDSGVINGLLLAWHVVDHPVDWLGHRWTGMLAISLLGIWKGLGWSMLILLASLAGVSQDLHEAAAIDGANAWDRFRHVTLPHIRTTLVTITILLVMGGFNVFPSVLLMTNGGPVDQTQVPLTWIYKQAFTYLDFGYGAALSYLLAIVVVVVSLAQYWLAKRTEASS